MYQYLVTGTQLERNQLFKLGKSDPVLPGMPCESNYARPKPKPIIQFQRTLRQSRVLDSKARTNRQCAQAYHAAYRYFS